MRACVHVCTHVHAPMGVHVQCLLLNSRLRLLFNSVFMYVILKCPLESMNCEVCVSEVIGFLSSTAVGEKVPSRCEQERQRCSKEVHRDR